MDRSSHGLIASRIYFKRYTGDKFKRFEDDGVNSALNYGYMVLRAIISSKVFAKFHPSLGINHHSQFNGYNLSRWYYRSNFKPIVDYVVYYNQEKKAKVEQRIKAEVTFNNMSKNILESKEYNYLKLLIII